ncbi:MAG: pantoate--beta-alanine ligase [Rhodocyclaceae bacterium]|nr:pantoate--beta-alanine ligase [Rhodocyclaceae bacterium]
MRAKNRPRLSSRNGYLSEAERAEAPRLYRAMGKVRRGHTGRSETWRGSGGGPCWNSRQWLDSTVCCGAKQLI